MTINWQSTSHRQASTDQQHHGRFHCKQRFGAMQQTTTSRTISYRQQQLTMVDFSEYKFYRGIGLPSIVSQTEIMSRKKSEEVSIVSESIVSGCPYSRAEYRQLVLGSGSSGSLRLVGSNSTAPARSHNQSIQFTSSLFGS
jgi:hypothetical protein